MDLFYFSRNLPYAHSLDRTVFDHILLTGYHDRDDKVVDWVTRSYQPQDGRPRYPLRIKRDLTYMSPVWNASLRFVVSNAVRDELRSAGSGCEFLEVQFDECYRVPVQEHFTRDFELNDERAVARYLSRWRVELPQSLKFYEIIAPFLPRQASSDGPAPRNIQIDQPLHLTKTTEPGRRLKGWISAQEMQAFGIIDCGGPGLLCTPETAAVLTRHADPDWFVAEPITTV